MLILAVFHVLTPIRAAVFSVSWVMSWEMEPALKYVHQTARSAQVQLSVVTASLSLSTLVIMSVKPVSMLQLASTVCQVIRPIVPSVAQVTTSIMAAVFLALLIAELVPQLLCVLLSLIPMDLHLFS